MRGDSMIDESYEFYIFSSKTLCNIKNRSIVTKKSAIYTILCIYITKICARKVNPWPEKYNTKIQSKILLYFNDFYVISINDTNDKLAILYKIIFA